VKTNDDAWFEDHQDRNFRIRVPERHAKRVTETEYEREFRSLGDHKRDRRRIIVARNPSPLGPRLMPIPFLLFADETVEDRDDILGPIFHEIMKEAGKAMGVA
jgi:hypothetical protein